MSDATARLHHNTKLLYLNNFLEYSYYTEAVYVLFGTHYLNLSYFQAGSLFFIGWFVSILFDFLGGVVADAIGRKRTQLLGLVLEFLGYLPYLFVRSYPVLAATTILWGLGLALTSNTLHALVYEQAVELGDKETYQKLNAVSQVWLFAGLAIATVIGGVVYSVNPRLPYVLLLTSLLLAFLVCWQIDVPQQIETNLAVKDKSKAVVKTALQTFSRHRSLLYFVVISFIAGFCSDLLFSYYQPYLIKLHVTALTLGIVFACIRVVSGFGSYLMQKLPDTLSLPTIQALAIVCTGVSAALLLVLKLPVVLLVPVVTAIGFGFTEPAMRLFVNRHAEDSARAAALSVGSGVIMAVGGEFGLTSIQTVTLLLLDDEHPRTMGTLSLLFHCDASNMTGIIDGLEEKKLVSRQNDRRDRRIKTVCIEPAGKKMQHSIINRLADNDGFIFDALTDVEAKQFVHIVEKLAQAKS